jgi:hypothetical protein
LSDREYGAQFCRFEKLLLFDDDYRDYGFVHFISPRTIELKASRFTEIDRGRVYLLPGDIANRLNEGQFVKIIPGRIERAVLPERSGRMAKMEVRYREVVEVVDAQDASIPLPPPSLPMDEFIYRTSSNWKYAEEDLLDRVISILFVSAPPSVYGEGGIGSEGLETMRLSGAGSPLDVSNTITSQLPVEFRLRGSASYRYSIFDSLRGYKDFIKERSSENAYSVIRKVKFLKTLKEVDIPVHLPFVLNNAEMTDRKGSVDLDVIDYQLTALYTPPPTDKAVGEMAERLSRAAHKEAVWDGFAATSIDPLSSLRIGLSLTRLSVGKQFDGKGFTRRPSALGDGEKLFKELMKRGLEEVERKMRKEKIFTSMDSHPWRGKLRPLDREVFFELRTMAEETGNFDLIREGLDIGIPQHELEKALERLNRYGYILFLKGGTVIRIIIDSSPEDNT